MKSNLENIKKPTKNIDESKTVKNKKEDKYNQLIINTPVVDEEYSFKSGLVYIWGLGVLILSILLIYTRIRLSKDIKRSNRIKDRKIVDIFEDNKEKLKVKRNIGLCTGSKESSPFIIGLIKPIVYIPENVLLELNDEQISHVLLHELSHYKRGDLLFNSLQILALILHWFNPLIWISMKMIKVDRELACDDYVMDKLGGDKTLHYGYTLIELAKFNRLNKNNLISIHFADDNNQTRRRVEMVKKYEEISKGKKLLIGLAVVLIGLFILTNARNKRFDKSLSLRENDDSEVIVETQDRSYYDMNEKFKDINESIKIPDHQVAGLKFLKVEFSDDNDKISMYYSDNPESYHRGFYEVNTYIYTISKEKLPMANMKYRSYDYDLEDYDESEILEEYINLLKDEEKTIAGKKINCLTYEYAYLNRDSGIYAIDNKYNWEDEGLYYQIVRSESDNPRRRDGKDRYINTFEINDNRLEAILESIEPITEKSLASYRPIGAKNWKDKVYTEQDLEKIFEKMGYEIGFERKLLNKYKIKDIEINNYTFFEKENSDKNINHGLRIEYDNDISLLVNTREGINYDRILKEGKGEIKTSCQGGIIEESEIINIEDQKVHHFIRNSKEDEEIYIEYEEGIIVSQYFWKSEDEDFYLLEIPQIVGGIKNDWNYMEDISIDQQIKIVESIIKLN